MNEKKVLNAESLTDATLPILLV